MSNPTLQCKDCGWIGLEEDCVKTSKWYFGGVTIPIASIACPECGSTDLLELDGLSSPLLVPA